MLAHFLVYLVVGVLVVSSPFLLPMRVTPQDCLLVRDTLGLFAHL
jgi:hypothetical protein